MGHTDAATAIVGLHVDIYNLYSSNLYIYAHTFLAWSQYTYNIPSSVHIFIYKPNLCSVHVFIKLCAVSNRVYRKCNGLICENKRCILF